MPQGSVTTQLNIAGSYTGTQVSMNEQRTRLAAGSSATSGAISMDALRYTLAPTQQGGSLVGTGATGAANQGRSVAVSADGNTFAMGGPRDDPSGKGGADSIGATWIFTRSGTTWTQQGSKLVGTGGITLNQRQGAAVALSEDGNTLAVGGPDDNSGAGATWIFTRSGSTWTQQGSKLVGTGGAGTPSQGTSVALSADGNTLAVGGPFDSTGGTNYGATWIFTRSGSTWTQQGSKLVGTGGVGLPNQGYSIALSADGSTLAAGGRGDNSIGATWIFTRSGTTWTQQGSKLVGTGGSGSQSQGTSVALSADGSTLAAGAENDNTNIGATWIFTRSGTTWTQQGSKLVGTGGAGTPYQGSSVALSADGNVAVVGGYGDASFVGAIWIFTRTNTTWTQQGSKLVGTGTLGFGLSVATMGTSNTVVVGAPFTSGEAGSAYVYI